MSYTFTLQELASDLGTNTADGLRNVANTAANFACDLYQNYAAATTGFPDPTGIGAFNNALYSNLCGPRNKLPPPPVQPFTGGQCPVRYNVSFSYTDPVQGPGSGTIFNVLGPISGVVRGRSGQVNVIGAQGAPDPPGRPDGIAIFVGGDQAVLNRRAYTITSVTRADGQPDNCGNPNPQFPDKAPPLNQVQNTTNITNIGAGVLVNAPIFFTPVQLNANVDIAANIQVNVGPFNVSFDLGGVNIRPNFDLNPNNPGQRPTQPYLPPNGPTTVNVDIDNAPANQTVVPCDLSTVLSRLTVLQATADDIKNCSCPVSYTQGTVSLGGGEGGVVALPTNCVQVRLQLTTIPLNAKFQEGRGDSPDQYFCGYYSFGDGVGQGARVAINTAQSVFEVPVWATSFSWNLYAGYDCIVTGVRLVPSKQNSELISRQMFLKPT